MLPLPLLLLARLLLVLVLHVHLCRWSLQSHQVVNLAMALLALALSLPHAFLLKLLLNRHKLERANLLSVLGLGVLDLHEVES